MQNIPITTVYKHPVPVLIGLIAYAALVVIMTINSEFFSSFTYVGCLVCAIAISFILPIGAFCNCLFFTIPFTAVLKLPIEAFSFITLMQFLLIIRTTFFTSEISGKVLLNIVLFGILSQILPLIIFSQTINNVILLIFNLMTFYCIYSLTKSGEIEANHAYVSFSFGVLVAGLIALNLGMYVVDMQEYRFCGLWTDPNFWGMFCLIGIVACLVNGFRKITLWIILLPVILNLFVQGYMTLSRTFIIVSGLMAMVILWYGVRRSIFLGILIGLGFYVVISFFWQDITNVFLERSLDSEHITNGRYENTETLLDYIENNVIAILGGLGYNNSMNFIHTFDYEHGATHNTYVDLFIEFGLIVTICIIYFLLKNLSYVRRLLGNIGTLPGFVICVIIFYMGTLSILKYILLFLFAGVFVGSISQNIDQIPERKQIKNLRNKLM